MAKRKKSKRQLQSEPVASAAAAEASESVEAQGSTEAEAGTALPTPPEASPVTSAEAEGSVPAASDSAETAAPDSAEVAAPDSAQTAASDSAEVAAPDSAQPAAEGSVEAQAPDGAETAAPESTETLASGSVETPTDQAWPDSPIDTPNMDAEAAPESGDFATVWQDGDQALAAPSELGGDAALPSAGPADPMVEAVPEGSRLEAIIESLLFASDKALSLHDLRRLLGERDGKKITAAVQSLMEQRKGSGIEVVAFSSGWHLRTNPDYANWVSRLLAGKPVRLSRAMLETLAIVAYRQPVTRPEIDDIRGVDCGPVLRTLLDRGLVRIIGKKEEVGRPMLYGTTPEFLRIFNLRDLAELPTLREFYELTAEDRSQVESEHGAEPEAPASRPDVTLGAIRRQALTPEEDESDPLLDELDNASRLAKKALGDLAPAEEPAAEPATAEDSNSDSTHKPKPAGKSSAASASE